MFDNPVPVFEFEKDSFILKHKLNYNTSCNDEWSGITNKMLFTDYNLSRKSQTKNAENYDPINISLNLDEYNLMRFVYYDKEYNIGLYGRLLFTESGDTTTVKNNFHYQEYYIDPFLPSLIDVGDYVNIYFHTIETITGTTTWEYNGIIGDTWVKAGTTDNNIDWQVTGITDKNGYNSGTATWEVEDYRPLLKYKAKIIEIGSDYIRLEKKIEDYLYNNLMYNYNNVYYVIESLDYTIKTYESIKYIFQESIWSDYFNITATDNDITFEPIKNEKDIYFDYDNVNIDFFHTSGTIENFKFNSDCLYTKYKLDRFFDQLGFESGYTIHNNYTANIISQPYNDDIEFKIDFSNVDDAQYFIPYTYVKTQVNNLSGNTYISLIKEISGSTITLITSRDMENGDVIISINNLYNIKDISDMLYECFINIEGYVDINDSEFYTANLFDPNIQGYNVIECSNVTSWVFDPS